jgi:hypothetical protein
VYSVPGPLQLLPLHSTPIPIIERAANSVSHLSHVRTSLPVDQVGTDTQIWYDAVGELWAVWDEMDEGKWDGQFDGHGDDAMLIQDFFVRGDEALDPLSRGPSLHCLRHAPIAHLGRAHFREVL